MSGYFVIKTREKTRTDNGQEFLYNKKPDRTPENDKLIYNFFSKKIVINDNLKNAEPGLYTWILRSSGNIFASKTLSKQEIGTLHSNLKMLSDQLDKSDIYAAGELEIIKENNMAPSTITFNLLSGSFMADKFKRLRGESNSAYQERTLKLRNKLVNDFQGVLSMYGISSHFLECSMITCSDEEKIGGMKLIESANIRTNKYTLNNLNKLFVRKYGGKTRKVVGHRRTIKSRGLRNK
jgi:hypothetical protein